MHVLSSSCLILIVIAVLQQEPFLGCAGKIYSLIAVLHQGIFLSQHDPTLTQ